MMDRYNEQAYRFGGRDRRRPGGDYSPYRRPMGRGTLPAPPYGGGSNAMGGCGCGLTRQPGHGRNRPDGDRMPHSQHQALPVMETGGCGCGHGQGNGPDFP